MKEFTSENQQLKNENQVLKMKVKELQEEVLLQVELTRVKVKRAFTFVLSGPCGSGTDVYFSVLHCHGILLVQIWVWLPRGKACFYQSCFPAYKLVPEGVVEFLLI